MPIRISGTVTARSSSMRIRNTTTSTIGGITMESQPAASRTSNSTALAPPTTVPSTAPEAASRIGSTRSKASVEYGGGSRVAWIRVPCSPSATGGETVSIPSVCSSAVVTACTSPPGGTITSAGALAPAGKLFAKQVLTLYRLHGRAVTVVGG